MKIQTVLKMNNNLMLKKFRGALLGALMGDCFGGPYEGEPSSGGTKTVLQQYFDKMDGPPLKAPVKKYSDDTAMTKCIAMSLIEKSTLDSKDLAKQFVREFFTDPNRGYGASIPYLLRKLRETKFENVFKPAAEQFDGSGSYGNGGAMRVSPIALFYHNNYDTMINAAKACTQITHSNKLGIDGALLQCIAVHQGLMSNPDEKIDVLKFVSSLIEKMAPIEGKDEEGMGLSDPTPYQTKLKRVMKLLKRRSNNDDFDEEVIEKLGHNVTAIDSVPTAIFCFLYAQSEIPNIVTDNPFRRTIQYAISLGGDTDTIASMAGSIAGAYYGEDIISKALQSHCEASDNIVKIADDLFSEYNTEKTVVSA